MPICELFNSLVIVVTGGSKGGNPLMPLIVVLGGLAPPSPRR